MTFRKAELNPNWKGGIRIHKIHRQIMEKHIGRKLSTNEDVHHINGNHSDNRIENLQILTHNKHLRIHRLADLQNGKKLFPNANRTKSQKYRENMSKTLTGRKLPEEHKTAISEGIRLWWANRRARE